MKKCRTIVHAVSQSYRMLKLLRIMKLTTMLLLIATLQVFAEGVYSQSAKLTLNLGDTNVGQVLTEIENQSEFYFLFNQKLVDIERNVHVRSVRKDINVVLDQVFAGTNIDYFVMDRQIVLSPSEYLAEVKNALQSDIGLQTKTITGTITDESGLPLLGVTIYLKGTTTGTISDSEGHYSIEVPGADAVLVISYIGYQIQAHFFFEFQFLWEKNNPDIDTSTH